MRKAGETMGNGVCVYLTGKINELKRMRDDFKSRLTDVTERRAPKELMPMMKEMQDLVSEIESKVAPDKIFMEMLRKDETWEYIGMVVNDVGHENESIAESVTNPKIQSRESYDRFTQIFDLTNDGLKINQKQYERFADNLLRDKDIKHKIEQIYESDNRDKYYLYAVINSIFLNKYLRKDQEMVISDEVSKNFTQYFLCHLKKGKIKVGEGFVNLALFLDGATVEADEVYSAGGLMQSGELTVGKAENMVGDFANGGRIKVGESTGAAGFYCNNMTLELGKIDNIVGRNVKNTTIHCESAAVSSFEKFQGTAYYEGDIANISRDRDKEHSTFLLEDKSVINGNDDDFYWYDENSRAYWGIISEVGSASYIDVENFLDEKQGLIILDESFDFKEYNWRVSVYELIEKMEAGIFVMRVAPKTGEIGKGMRGGILILEDPNLSLEEARARVSKDRPGGFVFMRVPDEENLGKTRLEKLG